MQSLKEAMNNHLIKDLGAKLAKDCVHCAGRTAGLVKDDMEKALVILHAVDAMSFLAATAMVKSFKGKLKSHDAMQIIHTYLRDRIDEASGAIDKITEHHAMSDTGDGLVALLDKLAEAMSD